MVYFTGDIHGVPWNVVKYCKKRRMTHHDTLVIHGDVGANYHGDERDDDVKEALEKVKPTVLCIHGNHEQRPWNIPGYAPIEWNGGKVMVHPEYPSVLFAMDGEIFTINGLRYLVIGGAYSVDKYYRLHRGLGWWADEQPSEQIKKYVEQQVKTHEIDVVLSHTCPYKYEPQEMFLPMIDQNTVDDSTEKWLDTIEEALSYKAWYCGHWHTTKQIDRIHFLYHGFETDEWLHEKEKSHEEETTPNK